MLDQSGLLNVCTVAGVTGDGVHDDTAGLQAALDSGAGTVHFPKPPARYLISRTLVIHSGQTLLADRHAVIRLGDKADAHMLTNADPQGGDRGIKVVGGIWDGNNAGQTPHGPWRGTTYDPGNFLGVLMQFNNVRDLYLGGLTLKDPEAYGIQAGRVCQFTIEDITFDYNMLRGNMDGVHVHGPASDGRIVNLKGATNDDQVALNADDGGKYEISRGPITNIRIDGIWADNGYTAVRLLSAGSPVRGIQISNIFGSYRLYAVSFTHHNVHPGAPSTFEEVSIDGVFYSKPRQHTTGQAKDLFSVAAPPIWFAAGTRTEAVLIRNVQRAESLDGVADTIVVDPGAAVSYMAVSDVSIINRGPSELGLMTNSGDVGCLNMANVRVKAEGGSPRGHVLRNRGHIASRNLANICAENLTGIET
jgi:hypothetical protein